MNESIVVYIIVVNAMTFLLMGIDKQKARKHQFRIPERTFFLLSFFGGAVGALFGMRAFRHKTKHVRFTVGIPVLIVWNFILFSYLFVGLS